MDTTQLLHVTNNDLQWQITLNASQRFSPPMLTKQNTHPLSWKYCPLSSSEQQWWWELLFHGLVYSDSFKQKSHLWYIDLSIWRFGQRLRNDIGCLHFGIFFSHCHKTSILQQSRSMLQYDMQHLEWFPLTGWTQRKKTSHRLSKFTNLSLLDIPMVNYTFPSKQWSIFSSDIIFSHIMYCNLSL